jgi:EAL domain-containing protein (putative c-di-GMP-specific phosphodiesterase class I)
LDDWAPVLILKCQSPEEGEEEYVFVRKADFKIGRRPENDLRIARPDISGVHAQLLFVDGNWMLEDLRSTNGTFVSGKKVVNKVPVNVGDVIHFATKGYMVVPEVESDVNVFATKVLTDPGEIKGMVALLKIINEQRTYPYFQPIIDLAGRNVIGWESLGRASAEEGLVNLSMMFRLATANRIEAKLSEQFRDSSCQCVACGHCWPRGTDLLLFFNIHPAEIRDKQLIPGLKTLVESGLGSKYRIVIEMPESWVCKTAEMQVLVREIRDLGLLVAYDDFGQGQSRIPDLIKVPPDYLKLDRELVTNLGSHPIKHGIVKAVVDACRQLHVKTLGEGIENEDELKVCIEMGIELGQGYAIGKPKPAYELFGIDQASLPQDCIFLRLEILRP